MDTVGTPGAANQRHRFDELAVVSFRRPVTHGGRSIPAGTKAIVAAAYADGIGYSRRSMRSIP